MSFRSFLAFTLAICTSLLFSFKPHQVDLSPSANGLQVVDHQYFQLAYSETHEQAAWVAYELTSSMTYGTAQRQDNFHADSKVTTESAQLYDYKGSGYDRGHLCPAADMKFSQSAMDATFCMSNMSPQVPSFNRGIWKELETQVREWAREKKRLYVVTGAVLNTTGETIGANQVTVPDAYYKLIMDVSDPDYEVIAFVMPNRKCIPNLLQYAVSVDSAEALTGIDFYAGLPDEVENRLESELDVNDWTLSNPVTYSGNETTPEHFEAEKAHAPQKQTTSVQCRGIAKSTGVRCKLNTKNVNGYCHHHQAQVR